MLSHGVRRHLCISSVPMHNVVVSKNTEIVYLFLIFYFYHGQTSLIALHNLFVLRKGDIKILKYFYVDSLCVA